MLPSLLVLAVLPWLVLWRIRLRFDSFWRALLIRLLAVFVAILLGAGALLAVFQDVAPLMRNNKEIRYLITPANYLYSLVRVISADAGTAARPRQQIGLDATPVSYTHLSATSSEMMVTAGLVCSATSMATCEAERPISLMKCQYFSEERVSCRILPTISL